MINEIEDIVKALDYNPDTGLFCWKIRRSPNCTKGWFAGSKSGQYLAIRVHNKLYMTHRLAWVLTTGEWPKNFIDHRNENKRDNRLYNLRDVSKSLNGLNITAPNKNNKNPHRGITKWQGKYRVQFQGRHVGSYTSPEEAAEVYKTKKESYFVE